MSEVLEIRKRAHELVQAGEFDKAIAEYRKLLRGDEVDPNIYNLIGDVYYKKGDVSEAFNQYTNAVKRYAEDGLYSNAIAVCRKMLRLNPDYIEALELLGNLFLEQGFKGEAVNQYLDFARRLIERGDSVKAVDALKKVIEVAPTYVNVREQLARVYLNLGLADEARSELLAAAELYERDGRRDQAEALRESAKQINPEGKDLKNEVTTQAVADRVEIVHKRIGLAHHVPLDIDEVLSSFHEEICKAIGEEDYQAHYDLGISYFDLGLYDQALAEFGVARKHPQLALKAIELTGRCFMEKGEIDLAIEEFRSGLQIEGHTATELLGLRYNLGIACEKIGRYDEAAECFREVCNCDPNFQDARARLEQIERKK